MRAKRIVELMHECGLEDVAIDGIGNVVGRWQGTDPNGPLLAIGAHMDTVFPEGTDVTVRQEGNRYYGPGIGDNCAGLRAVLETLRAMKAAGIRKEGAELVSCPTCGRTRIDLISLAGEVEERLKTVDKPITVAVMGCVVNGPGEASAADCGIAGGVGEGLLFKKGQIIKKVPQDQLVDELFALIDTL